jgi:AcrR family transcriptional regulator
MPRDATPAASPRSRPRAGVRDRDRTRAAILAAATEEFAAHGLGGARVDRIAALARTNKRMLYYYFGDKEALYLAVLEAAYAHIRGEEQKLDLLDRPPEDGVRELCAFTWRYFVAHPEFMSLLNTENLNRARYLRRSRHIRAMHSPLIAVLNELLERGAREGVFRRGVDPVQLYISIASLGYFYLTTPHPLSTICGRDLGAPRARAARLAHIAELVVGYLTGRPSGPARRRKVA